MSKTSLIGKEAVFKVRLDEAMLDTFAALSGDRNKIHMSAAHAARRGHPGRVAHGALLAGFVSRLVGEHLPGGDVLLLSLKMDFHHPVYPGDMLVVRGTVVEESPSTATLEIKFSLSTRGVVVSKGTALVQGTSGNSEWAREGRLGHMARRECRAYPAVGLQGASNAARCPNHRSPKGLSAGARSRGNGRVFFPAAIPPWRDRLSRARKRLGTVGRDWPTSTPCRWEKSVATRPFPVSGGALQRQEDKSS